jgi:hypothetical protein
MVVLKHGGSGFQARYPQLCEAQIGASGRLPGTPVQRLATIGHGDGIGATHVTAPLLVHIRITTISTADTQATESGGISA